MRQKSSFVRKERYPLVSWKQNWGYGFEKLKYLQIVRRKLKALRVRRTDKFGSEAAEKTLKRITDAARGLEELLVQQNREGQDYHC